LERISRFLVVKSWKELERVKSWTELEKLKDGVRDRDSETKVVGGGDSIVSFFIARYINNYQFLAVGTSVIMSGLLCVIVAVGFYFTIISPIPLA
jgi:hypothetical protein